MTVGGTVVGGVDVPLVLCKAGFGLAGVTAGSWAAVMQTPNIAAGSIFAIIVLRVLEQL